MAWRWLEDVGGITIYGSPRIKAPPWRFAPPSLVSGWRHFHSSLVFELAAFEHANAAWLRSLHWKKMLHTPTNINQHQPMGGLIWRFQVEFRASLEPQKLQGWPFFTQHGRTWPTLWVVTHALKRKILATKLKLSISGCFWICSCTLFARHCVWDWNQRLKWLTWSRVHCWSYYRVSLAVLEKWGILCSAWSLTQLEPGKGCDVVVTFPLSTTILHVPLSPRVVRSVATVSWALWVEVGLVHEQRIVHEINVFMEPIYPAKKKKKHNIAWGWFFDITVLVVVGAFALLLTMKWPLFVMTHHHQQPLLHQLHLSTLASSGSSDPNT